jgi:2-polyprenyl-3-methyl-5-hydroxy-6-metoxy-1,4-benzoquinol methylase
MKNKNFPKVICNRWLVIEEYCKDKVVLDIGCVDHEVVREEKPYWLHKRIKSVASNVVGVDILEEEVRKLNQKGYNIIVGDALSVDVQEKFDVVVAGEFIEHISDHGVFLKNMRKHLKADGKLVITTPNMFAFRYQFWNFVLGEVIPNEEHVCWFDYYTLKELCERSGFRLVKSYYHFDPDTPWYKYYPVRLLTYFRKNYAPRIMFVLKKNT